MYNLYCAVWDITSRCNLNCMHCMTSATNQPKENELSTEEGSDLIEELAKLGCKVVVLTGGEPFLRDDWSFLARKIIECGMRVCFISNAYAIDEDIIDLIGVIKPASIAFSIDGASRETHDYIRGKKGSFDKILNTTDILIQKKQHISFLTTVSKINYNELDDLLQIAISKKIATWQIQIAKPQGKMPKDLILNEEEYYKLAEKIVEFRQKYNNKHFNISEADCIGYYSKLTKGLEIKEWQGCQCGLQMVSIESDGGVKGCPAMEKAEANIRESSFTEIWNNPNSFEYNRKFLPSKLKGYCKKCKYGNICHGGCPINPTSCKGTEQETPYCLYKIEKLGYSQS